MDKPIKVLTALEYNAEEMRAYVKRWEEWEKEGGYNSNNYPPQQAFFGFYTIQGNFKNYGYVLRTERGAHWYKTKREAIINYNKKYE